ncbi:MAG TPA: hypothetical protein VGJ60_07385 [Chloroflexota bacterium]
MTDNTLIHAESPHWHGREQCTINHGATFVARDEAAREQLPSAFAELKEAEAALAAATQRVDTAQAQLRELLRDVIKDHRKAGEIGVTTMASGAVVCWIPENLGV